MALSSSLVLDAATDAQLVALVGGARPDAFEAIVRRYQGLVCALAYSAVGDVRTSEDIAQETFVAAWKGIAGLREPEKLRSWLCGIARRQSHNSRRHASTEPAVGADALDATDAASTGNDDTPAAIVADRDDAALVWRALAAMPETYREPLILYYRQYRSVEDVATALDLTPDAVKQRLSRGRERLKAEVAGLVEGALGASMPGPAFTSGVMAVLPLSALSAKTAIGGPALAKTLATFIAFGGAFVGIFAALWTGYHAYRETSRTSRSEEERTIVARLHRFNLVGMLALFASMAVFIAMDRFWSVPLWVEVGIVPAVLLVYFSLQIPVGLRTRRELRTLRAGGVALGARTRLVEYRSRTEFLGLPLVHVRLGGDMLESSRPVKAWIAAGGFAFGGLAAYGGVAVAPFAFGGVSIGLCAVGGLALAAVSVAGIAVGGLAVGGQSLGWIAFGGCAIAIKAAFGGIAIARQFAAGGSSHAMHADDAAAGAFFSYPVWRSMIRGLPYISWIAVIGMVPFGLTALLNRRRGK